METVIPHICSSSWCLVTWPSYRSYFPSRIFNSHKMSSYNQTAEERFVCSLIIPWALSEVCLGSAFLTIVEKKSKLLTISPIWPHISSLTILHMFAHFVAHSFSPPSILKSYTSVTMKSIIALFLPFVVVVHSSFSLWCLPFLILYQENHVVYQSLQGPSHYICECGDGFQLAQALAAHSDANKAAKALQGTCALLDRSQMASLTSFYRIFFIPSGFVCKYSCTYCCSRYPIWL
jgi:hypothetical protein